MIPKNIAVSINVAKERNKLQLNIIFPYPCESKNVLHKVEDAKSFIVVIDKVNPKYSVSVIFLFSYGNVGFKHSRKSKKIVIGISASKQVNKNQLI